MSCKLWLPWIISILIEKYFISACSSSTCGKLFSMDPIHKYNQIIIEEKKTIKNYPYYEYFLNFLCF